jgi:hypothetical protein
MFALFFAATSIWSALVTLVVAVALHLLERLLEG